MIFCNNFSDNDLFDPKIEQIELCALSNVEENNYLDELQFATIN